MDDSENIETMSYEQLKKTALEEYSIGFITDKEYYARTRNIKRMKAENLYKLGAKLRDMHCFAAAEEVMMMAADKGCHEAEFWLGDNFDSPYGMIIGPRPQTDYGKAIHWYKKASEGGIGGADWRMAVMCRGNYGMEYSEVMYKRLLEEAVRKNCDAAKRELIRNYINGSDGYEKDLEKAEELLERFPDIVDIYLCVEIGMQHFERREEWENARNWFEKGIQYSDDFRFDINFACLSYLGIIKYETAQSPKEKNEGISEMKTAYQSPYNTPEAMKALEHYADLLR